MGLKRVDVRETVAMIGVAGFETLGMTAGIESREEVMAENSLAKSSHNYEL